MGDGFATVDNRNLKNTGKSSSLNRTMAADYRLRHIPTQRDMDLSLCQFCIQWDTVLLFTKQFCLTTATVHYISLLCIYCITRIEI